MKLLLKFNLVFLAVFLAGLAVSALIARSLLQRDAQDEVLDRARLLMEKASVVSTYTATQIAPLLREQMEHEFLPQSIPSFSSMEILNALRAKYPGYGYKPAMLNPTNPRDRAVDWEADVIQQFRQQPERAEFVGQRDTPTGRALYIARPIKITNAACLQCHSTVDAAPHTLLAKYGPNNGFGWTMNEAIGAQVVSVPMSVPVQRADKALVTVIGLLSLVFLAIGAALNVLLWKLVIQPVRRLSALSDRVSLGELDAPEFIVRSKDEIGTLTGSFARMRKSLVHAMKLLDQ
jgi:HAMP domain-containing protein